MRLRADLRQALRSYARAPGLAATLVLTIALGAGVNAALFGFIGGLVSVDLSEADPRVADRFGRVAVLLAGASALVFGLAAATVASLLLSRARGRAQEMATRVALGASDGSLFRLCLTDVALVTAAGGAAGIVAGWWTVFLFPMLFYAPDAESLVIAPRVSWVAISSAVWLAVLVVAGTLPAFGDARRAPNAVLRNESAGVSGASSAGRKRLVIAEVAIACLLLIVASAIREDLRATLRTARGEALGSLLVVPLLSSGQSTLEDGLAAYLDGVDKALAAVPGVTGWAFTTRLPGGWPAVATFAVEPPAARTRELRFDVSTFDVKTADPAVVTPVAGRQFGFQDGPAGPRVALVNEAAAERYFEGDAVGRVLEAYGGTLVEVVGVVPTAGDGQAARPELYYYAEQVAPGARRDDQPFHAAPGGVRPRIELDRIAVSEGYAALFAEPAVSGRAMTDVDVEGAPLVALVSEDAGLAGEPIGAALVSDAGRRFEVVGIVRSDPLATTQRAYMPSVRLPLRQAASAMVYLAVRTTAAPGAARRALDLAVSSVAGGRPLARASTLEEHLVRTSLAAERIASSLLGVVAAVALVIAVAGVSGALADLVTRRRRELAVRLALGAGAGQLVWQVVAAGLRIAGAGLAGAVVLAAVVVPVLGHVIAGPRLPDPVTAIVAGLATVLIVGFASALPAWHALQIDPREMLQGE